MELKLSSVPASIANFIGMRPVIGTFLSDNYTTASIKVVDEMTTKLLGRPYPKIRRSSSLILKFGTETSFFTNLVDGLNIDSITIFPYSEGEPRVSLSSSISVTKTQVGTQAYVTVNLISDVLRYQTFRLVFAEPSSGRVLYVSRDFVVLPPDFQNSTRIEFDSNRGVFHNFPYAEKEAGQTQKFEFMGSMKSFDYPEEREVYTAVTTGRSRTVNATLRRTFTLETYYQDFFAHEALAFAFFHESVNLNGRPVVVVEGYETNSENDKDLSSGIVVVEDVTFGIKTKACSATSGGGGSTGGGFTYLFDFQL